jgi:Asp-tRNA(Asn)/Glu-tRNA(Gln) amidotransferase C subunit
MSKPRHPADRALLEAAARLANLPLTAERAEQLVGPVDGVFQLLDALHRSPLDEIAPAFAFQAKWGHGHE